MKFFLFSLALFHSTVYLALAQAPQGIPYQAVARTAQGDPVVNAPVQVRFSLREQTASGTISYQEAQFLSTNDLGLFATAFGTGTASVGTFSGINWAQTVKFLQVEIDLGQGWVDMGTQQLMSVPYALYASATGSTSGVVGANGDCYPCPSQVSNISPNAMGYTSSFQYCSNLNEAGQTDWRVPTLAEIEYARDVLNLAVPSDHCWTKEYSLAGSSQQFIYVYYTSTNRAIGFDFNTPVNWKTVCIR